MSRAIVTDGCGCFPTGRHYAGIAHLLRSVARGLAEEIAADAAWYDMPVALIDLETTGRDASVDRVVEVGIVIGRGGEIVARHDWLINPGIPIPAEASAVHKIVDADVKDSPRFETVANEIAAALADSIPAAYNAAFDKAFITNEFARAGHRAVPGVTVAPFLRRDVDWFDPLVWAREVHKQERSRALGDMATLLGIRLENAHRASDDAEAALMVLYALAKDVRLPRAYAAFVQEQRRLALAQADERRRYQRSTTRSTTS
jgi:DNA polymerase-3 subunit epsilon